ncbi:MAG: hypothetical protein V3Q69_13835 (plasmid) [Burkholderia sp.]
MHVHQHRRACRRRLLILADDELRNGRCCINRARSVDVYAQWSRGQPPIKSDSRVTA